MKYIGKFGRKAKIGIVLLVVALFVTTATAALLPYWGQIRAKGTVAQAVSIDGKPWDKLINFEFDDNPVRPGCCYCNKYTITNIACQGLWLDWEILGLQEGLYAEWMYPVCGGCCETLSELEVKVLDGMAEYDDFDVYVDGVLVYSYSASGGAETWITHNIDLKPYGLPCLGTHTVKIDCTYPTPWPQWSAYGQLAVDYIALYCCDQHYLCDSVDIGKPVSEAGHNLVGWGPVEPMASGGGYGGIDDCRCTWYDIDAKMAGDPSWASVDLTCEIHDQGCEECDCQGIPVRWPLYLEPEESVTLCLCIWTEVNFAGSFDISFKLVTVTVI